jgi:2-methylcitrate dehydratase PrpD
MSDRSGAGRALGEFAASASATESVVSSSIADALANAIALMIQACDHEAAVRARAAFRPHANEGAPISVIGKRRRMPAPVAVLSNGISAHVEDFDDTCLPSILHPSAVVIPAAMAAAELRGASGRELLDATAVGMEVAIRAADGMGSRAMDRGWHVTGIIGPIGAAAAAGRVLGLDEARMASALSIAACQGSGVLAALGSMTKSLHPGRAAANGLEAAYLASAGVSVTADLLAGGPGLAEAIAGYMDVDVATDGLGSTWRATNNLVKPFACGVVSHPAIAAARNVRRRLTPDQGGAIRHVHVRVNPLVLRVMGTKEPRTSLQSKFSVYHAVAVGLLDGVAGVDQFRAGRVRAADVVDVRNVVEVETSPDVPLDEAELVVECSDGTRLREHVAGTEMTREDVHEKVRQLAAPRLGDAGVTEIISMLNDLGDLPAASVLIDAACGR